MVDGNIASEWDNYAATVVYKSYLPLTHENFELGYTEATTVTASTREWVPGYLCPDGHTFTDKSVVEATAGMSNTNKDMEELWKDDGVTPKSLKGNTRLGWHEEVRRDIEKAPSMSWYETNKWYISRGWSLKQQMEDMKKKKIRKRMRKPRRVKLPKWLDKAFNR